MEEGRWGGTKLWHKISASICLSIFVMRQTTVPKWPFKKKKKNHPHAMTRWTHRAWSSAASSSFFLLFVPLDDHTEWWSGKRPCLPCALTWSLPNSLTLWVVSPFHVGSWISHRKDSPPALLGGCSPEYPVLKISVQRYFFPHPLSVYPTQVDRMSRKNPCLDKIDK